MIYQESFFRKTFAWVLSESRQQAVLSERKRIMLDLHDSVGAKLLTLIYKAPTPEYREDARETLMLLRDTIRLSQKTHLLNLAEHIADWRTEIKERVEAAKVKLQWQQTAGLDSYSITPSQALELTQILREAVSNALKHAEPTTIKVILLLENHRIILQVLNDGKLSLPETWQEGTGIAGIKERINRLSKNAKISISIDNFQTKVQLIIPLGSMSKSSIHNSPNHHSNLP